MIGQTKLIEKLNTSTLLTLSKSNILVGNYGCGKHTFVNELATKFNMEVIDITDIIGNSEGCEMISDMIITNKPTIYTVDCNKINTWISYNQGFNRLLKLLEEPAEYTYIFILCEFITDLLPTVVNRCKIWQFDTYTLDELKRIKLLDNVDKYKILNTPGKLLDYAHIIDIYINDARKIFDYINQAAITNIFVLPEKLFYKEKEPDKLDLTSFCEVLLIVGLEYYLYKKISFEAYLLTNKLYSDSKRFNLDKKKLYEGYLIDLKDELKRFKN